MLLNKYLSDKIHFIKPEGGLAFGIVPKTKVDLMKLAKKLNAKGFEIMTPDKFSYTSQDNGLRLGYASLNEKQLVKGVIALAETL